MYSNTFTGASQYDSLIQGTSFNQCFNYNSISINPGFKPYFDQKFYAQADYKFLPIDSNVHAHVMAVGFGINF
ncbi:MAG: hypothetical protein H7239_09990 [Flavobacterium sp.]|nr:hypothetical protein [Flavobacterium sp.]